MSEKKKKLIDLCENDKQTIKICHIEMIKVVVLIFFFFPYKNSHYLTDRLDFNLLLLLTLIIDNSFKILNDSIKYNFKSIIFY